MNLPDPIVTFDETPSEIDVYTMEIPQATLATSDEIIDPTQLFPTDNDFNAKVEKVSNATQEEARENNIASDQRVHLKWNVVKTDSEVHIEKLGKFLPGF